MKLARPSSMTEEEVSEKIKEYKMKLKSLKETGPIVDPYANCRNPSHHPKISYTNRRVVVGLYP